MKTTAKKLWVAMLLGLAIFSAAAVPAQAQSGGAQTVRVLTVDGPVTQAMAGYVERGLQSAQDQSAGLVILQLNTPGGQITIMNDIVQMIRNSPVPVVVYVAPQGAMAASAGTVITLAGHLNAMAPDTTIGAASPVGSQGEDIGTTEEAKVKGVLKATVRSLAANRPPEAIALAEDTIENAAAVSASEALQIGLTDFVASDLDDLLTQLDGVAVSINGQNVTLHTQNAVVVETPQTLVEQALWLLTDPNIVFLLLTIGVQAILIELSSPGGWVAGFIGVICLALVVYSFGILPINLFGLIFILMAFVLFFIEVKTHTGGAMTIGGVVSFVAGALVLFNSVNAPGFARVSVPLVIGTGIVLAASFMVIVSFAIRAMRIPKAMGKTTLIGKVGVVSASLHPQGSVQVAGELWSAEAQEPENAIPAGAQVEVVAVEGLRLKVRPVNQPK
jgi:membrane-bound serine protease (ClpP class)